VTCSCTMILTLVRLRPPYVLNLSPTADDSVVTEKPKAGAQEKDQVFIEFYII
jgi:hypothetical protein